MKTARSYGWLWMATVVWLTAVPAWAAEDATPATQATSAPTTQGTPALTGTTGSDLLPAGTLLYAGWPGIDAYSKACKDTQLAELLKEPELQRLRTAWWETVWPAIEEQIATELTGDTKQQLYEIGKGFLAATWRRPATLALIGAGMGPSGPQVDVAIIIRADDEAAKLAKSLEQVLALAKVTAETAEEVTVGDLKFKQLAVAGPSMPLRWGSAKGLFIVSLGTKATEHLANGTLEDSLTRSPRFAAAMKAVGGRADSPFFYLDLKGTFDLVQGFEPMLAMTGIPALAEPGAIRRILKQVGAESCESLSIAMVPEAGGFKTSMFLHLPGASTSTNPLINRKALINDDIGMVPKSARWATVVNWDVSATYRSILDLLAIFMPGGEKGVADAVEGIEKRIGVSIEKELLGAFENNWAIFDSPDFGGIWFSGMVLVGKVKPKNQLSKAMRNIMEVIAEEIGGDASVTVETETYRGQQIEYVNVRGIPMPVAPAWAEFQGCWIVALYPQMVRMELDHLMNRGPSLLDNPDYQRGRKLMPEHPYSVTYVDTRAGMLQIYSFALPIWQIAAAMLQKESIPLDVSMLPSAQTVVRHMFGNVSASAVTSEGILTVSHGSLPIAVPAIGEGGFIIPLGLSVALPSLAQARSSAKRTVSMANLKGIGLAVLTWAEEHKGELPPDLKTLVDSGAITDKALRSPLDESDATSSYVYVEGQKNTMDPRNVVAYENPENYDNKATCVLFLDGHVEYMDMDKFHSALKDTSERLGRDLPTKPGDEKAKKTRPNASDKRQTAKTANAKATIVTLKTAIEQFKTHVGRYPNTLKELYETPKDEADAREWKGPYIENPDMLKDSWGHELLYLSPGEHNRNGYDLWSSGPDGKNGTDDDVTNWGKEQTRRATPASSAPKSPAKTGEASARSQRRNDTDARSAPRKSPLAATNRRR